MPASYESIPPEHEIAYMQRAAEAADNVSALLALRASEVYGPTIVENAQEMLGQYNNSSSFAQDVENFVAEHSLLETFSAGIEELRDSHIAEDAEEYLRQMSTSEQDAAHPATAAHPKRSTVATAMNDRLRAMNEDEIHRLMQPAPRKPDDPDGGLLV
jgi:hypothetical protein